MIDLHLSLDEEQYKRLRQRAHHEGVSVEQLILELLADTDTWRLGLENDPVAQLFGQIDDPLDPTAIDDILYARPQ